MRNKSLKAEEKNKKRERMIYRFLILAGITLLLGAIFEISTWFVTNLYTIFVLDFITASFMYAAGLIFCSFFLYCCFVITIFNPQRVKKSKVIIFALVGIVTLALSVFLLIYSVNETMKATQDMADYSNGAWKVRELVVTDVYRGGYHNGPGVLIDTIEGELSLHWESFLIYTGEKYRFTYLDATNTVIKVERLME